MKPPQNLSSKPRARSTVATVAVPESVRRSRPAGFTLIELIIVVAIIGILAALGTMGYASIIDKARVIAAIADIKKIAVDIDNYRMLNGALPPSLAEVGLDTYLDPWERPYLYVVITQGKSKPNARKDKNLHPINSEYDLCSKGVDGATALPLTAKASWDDVIRANDGGFVGLAKNY